MWTRGKVIPKLLRLTAGLRRAFAAFVHDSTPRNPEGGNLEAGEGKPSSPLKPERVQDPREISKGSG